MFCPDTQLQDRHYTSQLTDNKAVSSVKQPHTSTLNSLTNQILQN